MGECAWYCIPLLDSFPFQNRDEHDCTADHNHRCNRDYDPHKAAALRRNIVRHRGRENRLYLQYERYNDRHNRYVQFPDKYPVFLRFLQNRLQTLYIE